MLRQTALFGTVLLALALLIPWTTGFSLDGSVLEVFFSLFGAVYAILVGFIVFITMEGYNHVRRLVAAEVNALQDLRDFLVFVDPIPGHPGYHENVRQHICDAMAAYVTEVCEVEWPRMTANGPIPPEERDTPESLTDLMIEVNQIRPQNPSDELALGQMVSTLAQITTYRTDRLAAAGSRLPQVLRNLMVWLSIAAVVLFGLYDMGDSGYAMGVHFALNAILAYSVAFIYLVVLDLDDPFTGHWSVSEADYRALLPTLAAPPPQVPRRAR